MRNARVLMIGAMLLRAVLPQTDAAGQGKTAVLSEQSAAARRPIPLGLRRYHHTVWPLGEAAPLGRQASIQRSPDGYLWISSRAGVVRFDGVRFTILTDPHHPALRSSGTSGRDFAVRTIDRSGTLWITRPDGALVTYAGGIFRVAMDAPPAALNYFGPFRDGAGGLWVTVDSSGDERAGGRLVNGQVLRDTWPADVPRAGIRGIVPDTGDGMWIGTTARAVWHVGPRGSRRFVIPETFVLSPGDLSARPLLQSRDGALWVLVPGVGLMRMRDGIWSPVRLQRNVRLVGGKSVVEAPDGTVYVATRGAGVLRWSADSIEQLLPGEGAGRVVYDLLLDGEGSLWASTDAGLERFRRTAFAHVVRTDGLPNIPTFELAVDAGGRLWVSDHDAGLHRVDGADERRGAERMTMQAVPIPSGMTTMGISILRGAESGVWLSRGAGGLLHVDLNGTTAFGREAGLPTERVWNGDVDALGSLWLSVFPRGTGRFLNGRYGRVTFSRGGAERGGTFRIDTATRSIVFADGSAPAAYALDSVGVPSRLDRGAPLPRAMIAPVIEGRDTVWGMLLDPPGLARIANGRATPVRSGAPVDPLPGFNPQFVVAGGWLWFGSASGAGRFELAALHRAADEGTAAPTPQLFTSLDGLPMPRLPDYGLQRMVLAPDGRIWMSTPAGLAVVAPRAVPSNRVAPMVHVEEVVVDGRMLERGERADGLARIAASPGRIEIHFTALGLRTPERVRLEYRLDGVDPGWQISPGARVATYAQLRPGRYTFRVRAWNEDGVQSAGDAMLAMQVLPAWHQTWWASALGLAAVAGAGAAGASGVVRVRRRRADAAAEATIAERVRVARELHDTIMGDLAGIAMQLDAVALRVGGGTSPAPNTDAAERGTVRSPGRDTTVNPRDALRAIRDIRDQAHRSLDDARRAITAMRQSSDNTMALWERLDEHARRIFADTDVEVRVEHSGHARRHAPEVESEVLRIATEALINARRHAACRVLTVSCATGLDGLRVRVRDDGLGFDLDRGAADGHWGLVGMRERAAAIGAMLSVDSAPGRGTTIQVDVGPVTLRN